MKFGPVPLDQALGAILAHSHAVPDGRIRKGHPLTTADIDRLRAGGETEVVVARLETGDISEDAGAAGIAAALAPDPAALGLRMTTATTGRVNFYATGPGVLDLDTDAIAALNRIDPMITLATLPNWSRTAARSMLATVKIIAYGIRGTSMAAALKVLQGRQILRVRPVIYRTATLIETRIGAGDPEKGEAAIAGRLKALGMELCETVGTAHRSPDIARAIAEAKGEVVLILTASATSDPADVAPQALRDAGGVVTRFGMPVDPGNLLFLGALGNKPVIGLPGCARSPAANGADWVLERLVCGIAVSDDDIAGMGVGGLLKETKARGRPREA